MIYPSRPMLNKMIKIPGSVRIKNLKAFLKELPWQIGERSFLLFLVAILIGASLTFGILAKHLFWDRLAPSAEPVVSLESQKIDEILFYLEERQKLNQAATSEKVYPDPFLP